WKEDCLFFQQQVLFLLALFWRHISIRHHERDFITLQSYFSLQILSFSLVHLSSSPSKYYYRSDFKKALKWFI
ncbi:unnamed protein product, partial [Brassica oleracea var. botrytis]